MTDVSRAPEPTESAVVRRLADAVSAHDAAQGVLETVASELGWDAAMMWTPDGEGALLEAAGAWSRDDAGLVEFLQTSERLTFAPGVGLPGRVWSASALEWVENLPDSPDFLRAGIAAAAGLRSAVATPIPAGDTVVGVVELLSRDPRPRDPDDELLLRRVAGQLGHYLGRLRAESRLRETEERASAIFDAALDCVVTMDHRGHVLDLNPAAEATFGYPREEAVGELLAELIVPPGLRDAHLEGLRRYVATNEPRILGQRLELTAQRSDGSTFPIELTVTRVGRRSPPVFAGFMRDITERRDAEAERRRLVKEALASRASEEAARVHAEVAHAAAEADRTRMEFLARAGLRMAASMDYETTLEAVARTAVPDIADWCTVALVDARGRPEVLALAHVDPERERLAGELVRRYPPDGAAALGAAKVVDTRRPELVPEVDDELLESISRDPAHLELLRQLGVGSSLTVPVLASGRLLGAITLVLSPGHRRFSQADVVVASALAARAGLHIENARLYTERSRIAHTLQQGLLPTELPAIPGVEVAARYRAAGEQNDVGGDFYDVFQSDQGAWTAFVGDVSGKGAPAAVLTALARHSLYAAALRDDSPAGNLAFLNEAMLRRVRDAAAFCTVVYARLCPGEKSTTVTLASGGHPPPFVLRADGSVEPVDARGSLVGALERPTFEDMDLELAPGDLLFMYTDGAVEFRRQDLSFGEAQLRAVLEASAGRSAEAVVEAALARVVELQEGALRDDVALLALRAVPGSRS